MSTWTRVNTGGLIEHKLASMLTTEVLGKVIEHGVLPHKYYQAILLSRSGLDRQLGHYMSLDKAKELTEKELIKVNMAVISSAEAETKTVHVLYCNDEVVGVYSSYEQLAEAEADFRKVTFTELWQASHPGLADNGLSLMSRHFTLDAEAEL